MQPNLKHGMGRETYFSFLKGLAPGNGISDGIEIGKSLGGCSQELQTKIKRRLRPKPSSATWHLVLVLGDAILLVILLIGELQLMSTLHLRFQVPGSTFSIRNAGLIWICLALTSWCLAVNESQSQKLGYASSRFKSLCSTLFALVLMNTFLIVLSYLFLDIGLTTSAWLALIFLILALPVFTAWRILLAEVMNSPRYRPRAAIVGVNSAGVALANELQSAKHPCATILGYIGESPEEKPRQNGLPLIGGGGTLRYLTHHRMIDMMIIAPDYRTNSELFKEAIEVAQLGITVLPMTVVYESSTGKVPVDHVGDQWYRALQSERILSPLYFSWKKVLDLACGFCGLLILCLILPVIALLIHLDSPGPIFYSQQRVGLRGKPFRLYKFRSMYIDAEVHGQAVWATEYDPRITRIGRIMRMTHLDELPQLLNILRGDMSLIGPRPERAEFISELRKIIPFFDYRLAVKPGLTGWAQVKYRYGRTDTDALVKLQYDLYYIKHRSFMLDVLIILKTVFEVLSLRGS